MTASVIVMNAGGLALAADTAATIRYRGGIKHYRGASKVVNLVPNSPVALMWYGSSDHLGVPWEAIATEYRLKAGTLPALADYAKGFFDFLDDEMDGWALVGPGSSPPGTDIVSDLLYELQTSVSARANDQNQASAVRRIIDEWKRSRRPYQRVLKDEQLAGATELERWLREQLEVVKNNVSGLPDGSLELVSDAVRWAWTHLSTREPYRSGLVFAGYGDKERLPSVLHYIVGLPAGQQPRRASAAPVTITAELPAVVIPFAQNDSIKMFMEGIHPRLRTWIEGEVESADLPDEAEERLQRQLKQHIDDHGEPVVRAIRFFSKGDLAEFANALIDFTAFRMRMSLTDETVGGPIDVAVISRGEGLVWVKRHAYATWPVTDRPDIN